MSERQFYFVLGNPVTGESVSEPEVREMFEADMGELWGDDDEMILVSRNRVKQLRWGVELMVDATHGLTHAMHAEHRFSARTLRISRIAMGFAVVSVGLWIANLIRLTS